MPDDHHLIADGATIAYQLSSPPNTVPVGYGQGMLMSRQIGTRPGTSWTSTLSPTAAA